MVKRKKKIRMTVSLSVKITWDSNFTVHKALLEHIHGQFCMYCLWQSWEVTTETLWPTKPKICCLILYRIYLLTPYSRGKKRLPYGIYWVKTMWNLQRHEELFGATSEPCELRCWDVHWKMLSFHVPTGLLTIFTLLTIAVAIAAKKTFPPAICIICVQYPSRRFRNQLPKPSSCGGK